MDIRGKNKTSLKDHLSMVGSHFYCVSVEETLVSSVQPS